MSPARTAARRSPSRRATAGPSGRRPVAGRAGRRPVAGNRRARPVRGGGSRRRPAAGGHWWPGLLLVVAVLGGIAWQADATEPARTGVCTVPLISQTVSPEQAANAASIAEVGISRGLPDRAIVIALATAMQESRLRNLDYGDRDSLGLFQQRPSQGWGTPAQVRDPVYAAGRFYDHLVAVPGWQTGRLTDVAQAV